MNIMEKAKGNRTLETVSLIDINNLYKEYQCFVEEVSHKTAPLEIHITEDDTLSTLIQQLTSIGHRDIVDSEEIVEEATNDQSRKKSFLNVSSCSLIKELDITIPFDKMKAYITGSCFLSDGKLVICDNNNKTV